MHPLITAKGGRLDELTGEPSGEPGYRVACRWLGFEKAISDRKKAESLSKL